MTISTVTAEAIQCVTEMIKMPTLWTEWDFWVSEDANVCDGVCSCMSFRNVWKPIEMSLNETSSSVSTCRIVLVLELAFVQY